MAELGEFVTSRGHEVITISSKPGRGTIESTPSGIRILHRQWQMPGMQALRLQPAHGQILSSAFAVRRVKPDLVQSFYFMDAWASQLAGRRYKTVYYVTGPPIPFLQRRIPPDRWLLRRAIEGADELLVPSRFIQNLVEVHYGRKSRILPVPIHAEFFHRKKLQRSGPPVILAVAAFDERRKGLRVLLRAFARLVQRREATLRISGSLSERLRQEALVLVPKEASRSIEFLGTGRLEDLPELYCQAAITVLPAIWESYSLVALESWAAGTPVVAANHGAIPELVDDPAIGVLFEPGTSLEEAEADEMLATAMEVGLALADLPGTDTRCRIKALQYSWGRLGPAFEQFYLDLLSRS